MEDIHGVPPPPPELSPAQRDRIKELQDEIEAIWSKKGSYEIDDEAWRTMPIFMEGVDDTDVAKNESVAALSNLVYEDRDPNDVGHNRKAAGNKMLILAMNPGQVNPKNLARSAKNTYTEGLDAGCTDKELAAQLYCNRSQAHLIMENFGHAIEDAQRAIVLHPQYTKAYYRGAKAAERVGKVEVCRFLVDKGLQTTPPPSESAVAEFRAVLEKVAVVEQRLLKVQADKSRRERVAAADSNMLVRRIKAAGVAVSARTEVGSDQWAQGMRGARPYFDDQGLLHVPVLLLYDEASQSDFLHDVPLDACVADCLADMLPFPWDTEGRFRELGDIAAFFKVDDGVAMPEFIGFSAEAPLLEVFRHKKFALTGLCATLHIVRTGGPMAQEYGLK